MAIKSGKIKRWWLAGHRTLMNLDMLPKILRTAVAVYITKKPVVKQAGIMVDYNCPCRCEFCFADNIRKSGRPSLSHAEISKLIDDFAALGTLSICLTGGEPLVHPEILKYVKQTRRNKMLCSVVTSCVNYSDELWRGLKEAGLNTMYISVDAIGEKHDRFRGVPGIFQKVEKAIAMCRKLKIEFYFNGVVTNENIADGSVYDIVNYCQRNNIEYMILHTSASGRYAHPKYLLSEKNLNEFERIRAMDNVVWEGDLTLGKIGCPAGIQVISVSAFGDVMSCPFIDISFGNIRETPLKEAVEKMWSYDVLGNVTKTCLMGANRRFYQDWLSPLDQDKLPMKIEDHPMKDQKHWGTEDIVK